MRKTLLILSFVFLTASCAATNLAPLTQKDLERESDEKRIWLRSGEEQQVLNASGFLYENPRLEEYLNTVASNLYPPEVYDIIPFKIRVLGDPHFNAFAYPNGAVYVHTGILARIENEAQLATLLAHEMTHSTHRHAVKNFRSLKNKTAVLATVQVASAGLGGPVRDLANVLGSLGTMAAVTGYSRELESEADSEAIRRVVSAGYDPSEAPKLFVHLKKEIEEEKIKESFFFGTHPALQDRIRNFERIIDREYLFQKGGMKNENVYRDNVRELILDNAVLDLKLGRFKFARAGVENYFESNPESAKGYYVLGEIFGHDEAAGDIERSIEYFKKSIAADPLFPQAYRELGLIYYKQGKNELALDFFQQYLSLSGNPLDRRYIEHYIRKIE